jgi:hypothetical protein
MKTIKNTQRKFILICILAFLSLMIGPIWANGTTLELIILTDKSDSYTYYAELSDRELRNLQNNTVNEIQLYLIEARKECAREMGYPEEVYGKDNYKMVVVTKYSMVVRDRSNGRVILSR